MDDNKLGPFCSNVVPSHKSKCEDLPPQASILHDTMLSAFLYYARQGFMIDPIKESNDTIDIEAQIIPEDHA